MRSAAVFACSWVCGIIQKLWTDFRDLFQVMGRGRNGFLLGTIKITIHIRIWNDSDNRIILFGLALPLKVKVKGKGSSLDIVPLTILDSGALQPRKW